jgi:uracil-DNA glycosylase
MTAIVCDICKKAVAGARRDTTYIAILDKDICVPCSEELLEATKQQMKPRRPWLFKDYQATLVKNLAQMTK